MDAFLFALPFYACLITQSVLFTVLQVVKYWAEKGISGFTVFKYKLRRLEGQPTLTTNQVYFKYFLLNQRGLILLSGLYLSSIGNVHSFVELPVDVIFSLYKIIKN